MFLNPSEKVNFDIILDNIDNISKDYFKFKEQDLFFDYTHNRDEFLVTPKKTDYFWQICPLMLDGEDFPNMPEEIKNCFTLKLLKELNVIPVIGSFSILNPGGEVVPHTDHDDEVREHTQHIPPSERSNSVVKYHLSLDIPSDGECALIVGDENRILHNGDINVFDETVTHSAYNRSQHKRGVLIISFLRSDLY